MAATVSAWGKPGAWALDAEENESELLQQSKEDTSAAHGESESGETTDFPSLAGAGASKTKKKKPQALSLQEFSAYSAGKPKKGLTHDELLGLPTGPRERSAEELDRSKLGGGFRSYGGGARDEQPRRQGSFNRETAPSRADKTDDWGANKKSSANTGFERRERGERGGYSGDAQSRADGVDNWASNKNFAPSEAKRYERRGGSVSESSDGGGSDSSNWVRRKEEEGRRSGGAFDSLRERRGGGGPTNLESWGRKREESESSGGNRPRLNLQPRTLPLNEDDASVVNKVKGNPFGEARPREEVLKEKKDRDCKEIEERIKFVSVKDVASDSAGVAMDKTEKSWRKLESVDQPPQSASETENGHADDEDTDYKDSEI